MSKRVVLLGLSAIVVLALVAPSCAVAQGGKPLTDVTFSLDFIVLGRHAPWYVALAKGYYRDAGLNVKIIPAQGTAQAIQALESGVAQLAFSDATSLVLARARGATTARMVAANYQHAPYAIFSLSPGANVTTPQQLQGLEVASGAGSLTPKVIQGFMRDKGLDPGSVRFTNVDGAARVGMLLSGKVPAIETFIFSEPGIRRGAKDAEVKMLLLAEHGLELYANGILVQESMLKRNPQLVKAFVQASLQGFRDALRNPDEAAALQLEHVKGLNRDVIVAELRIMKVLATSKDTATHGLGWIDAGKMRKTVDFVVQKIGVGGKAPAPAELYTTEFLPTQPVIP